MAELNTDALMAAFSDDEPQAQSSGSKAAAPPKQQEQQAEGEAAPQEQQRGPASKRADKLRGEADTPRRAREAIDLGLQRYQERQYQAALDLFQVGC